MRYVTRAWASESEPGWMERPSTTVFEDDTGPVRTGILDQNGNPLFRVQERRPIGFALRPPQRG